MRDEDKRAFKQSLDDTMAFFGQHEPDAMILRKWWTAFADWTLQDFQGALAEHEKRGRFAPRPADLFEIRDQFSGKPTADEAWATALMAADEDETVVWTRETARAFAAAQEILQAGDKIGARMAFKGAYERECAVSSSPLTWEISLGHDAGRREQAIRRGLESRLLTSDQAARHLPPSAATGDGKAIAGLLTGTVSEMPRDEKTVERLEEIRRMLAKQNTEQAAKRERERLAAIEADRLRRQAAVDGLAKFAAERLTQQGEDEAREKLEQCKKDAEAIAP